MANFFEFQAELQRSASPPTTPAPQTQAMTVSELTAKITRVLGGGLPSSLIVKGEVSNFKCNNSSGHFYFTLKDPGACIDCVMFRSDTIRLKFEPRDGMELLAGGRVGVYGQRGRYQLYLSSLRPIGKGALELAFQQVRAKLAAEGLFAPERKKRVPAYPLNIVIITSPEAAALQDVLKTLHRFPWLRITLQATPVQGDGAAERIADAIDRVNATDRQAEVILLCRGGGSLEDLWSFNEEIVARAIAASRIPIVTGIGHEVDVSIADLVADHHAHTPTEAAQVIVARWRMADERLNSLEARASRALRAAVSECRQRLSAITRHEAFRRPLDRVNSLRQLLDDRQRSISLAEQRVLRDRRDRLERAAARLERFIPAIASHWRELLRQKRQQLQYALSRRLRECHERLASATALLQESHPRYAMQLADQRLNSADERLSRGTHQRLQVQSHKLEALDRQLAAVSPQSVLRRGYSITTRKKDGLLVRSAATVRPGDKLLTQFADGQVQSAVEDSKQLSLFE